MTWKGWLLTMAVLFAAYWAASTIEGTWIRWERFGGLTTSHLVSQTVTAFTPLSLLGLGWGALFGLRRRARRGQTKLCVIPLTGTPTAENEDVLLEESRAA